VHSALLLALLLLRLTKPHEVYMHMHTSLFSIRGNLVRSLGVSVFFFGIFLLGQNINDYNDDCQRTMFIVVISQV
jgi:hypothetical protein